MNQLQKQLLCLTALVSAGQLLGDVGTTSKIVPRSQSFNAARQIVGWDNAEWGINRKPQDHFYSSFNILFEYTRTFRDNRLAQALFGDDLICNECDDRSSIQISGSAVTTRAATDWLADYFGLPRDFQSTVSFKPSIKNYILEFSYYAGLDAWVDGMYFKIYGPFVHTNWNLEAEECISNQGTIGYFQGYFSSDIVPASNLNTSFLNYASGTTVPTINNDYDLYGEEACLAGTPPFTPGTSQCSSLGNITWDPLCCSRIPNSCGCEGGALTRNGFGELRFILGYNFLNDEAGDYHIGLGAYVAAPTGSRIGDDDCNGDGKGRYLFEPIVGNGKHWEFGGQLTAHSIWWRNEDETKSFGMYLEANVTHLFGACQTRCFDLCSAGSNSRYMLAELLDSNRNSFPGLNNTTFPSTPKGSTADSLGLEFAGEYSPVANITRRNVVSTIGAQGDVAFTVSYQSGGFQWDLGYNFWGRTCEKLKLQDNCCLGIQGDWALKGDQRVYGFLNLILNTYPESIAMRLPATDSQATINSGSNMANGVSYAGPMPLAPNNFYADNSLSLAAVGTGNNSSTITTYPHGTTNIYTSEQPVLIQENDFDLNGTRGISNKIFTHLNYAWPNCKDSKWTPYIGIGVEAECGGGNKSCCEDQCNSGYFGCNTGCNTSCNTGCDTSCNTSCNPCAPVQTCNQTVCNELKPCCTNVALSQWGVWIKLGTSYN